MKIFKMLLVVSTALLTASFASAQTWTQTSAPTNYWTSIASSADGTILVASANYMGGNSGIYVSTNSGATWTQTGVPTNYWDWETVASSADGSLLVAASDSDWGGAASPGWIYTSSNSGVTWSQTSAPGGDSSNWHSVASSADGTKLTAVVRNGFLEGSYMYVLAGIYTSTNSGATWAQTSAPTNSWNSVASSADGTKLAAVADYYDFGNGSIYTSTDSGTTWVSNNAPNLGWISVVSSADGTKLAAINQTNHRLYISTNSGTVWTNTGGRFSYWYAIASSADGTKLIASVDYMGTGNREIYVSTNWGTTWAQTNAPNANLNFIASSADGNKLAATVSGGGIWTSQTTPSPQLNIASADTNAVLSWIIPSTNFVLQQNLDLTTTNWTDLTNPPALNLTNLQNEVILSPTNNSGFYRLKTP